MSQTYQPNKRKRAKSHGFLVRSKSKTGQKVLLKEKKKRARKTFSLNSPLEGWLACETGWISTSPAVAGTPQEENKNTCFQKRIELIKNDRKNFQRR